MATISLAAGQADARGLQGFYDRRADLLPVVGLVTDVLETPVHGTELKDLLKSDAGVRRLGLDKIPIPHPGDREQYYAERHLEYWLSGLWDAEHVRKHCPVQSSSIRYLDFGGCTGRVARHFAFESDWEPWVCDINVRYSDWLDEHAPQIRAFQNRPFPHLPFADRYFDIVSAFSVFTHLDQDEIPWLLELRRVVKAGGYLYLTVIDEYCWEAARNSEWLVKSIGGGGNEVALAAALAGDIPADRYVLRYHDADAYNVNIFLRRDYIRRRWGAFFKSIDFLPGICGHQTGVVLQV